MSYTDARCQEFLYEVGRGQGLSLSDMYGVEFDDTGTVSNLEVVPDVDNSKWLTYMREVGTWMVERQDAGRVKLNAWNSLDSNMRIVVPEPVLLFDESMIDWVNTTIL